MEHALWMIGLGLVLGAFGTLIGVGGGFILMPVLLLLDPQASPETVTSISLAVVFFNSMSGAGAYAHMRRIDYKSGLLFAAATIPGAILGALTTDLIPRRQFNGLFGILMVLLAVYLCRYRPVQTAPAAESNPNYVTCTVVERNGTVHTYAYHQRLGIGLSVLVGYLSSLLGIGGGVVHVPAMVRLLNFPVHIATATSQFILAVMALTGTIVHLAHGSFSQGGLSQTLCLALGVLPGAQLGALLSNRVRGPVLLRILAVALFGVGLRIFWMAW